jgi:hypothetical protein
LSLPASLARLVKSRFGRHSANGRDAVAPLPEAGEAATEKGGAGGREGCVAGTSGRRPQHNSRRLGWHAVPTLPEADEAARAARGAAPTRSR